MAKTLVYFHNSIDSFINPRQYFEMDGIILVMRRKSARRWRKMLFMGGEARRELHWREAEKGVTQNCGCSGQLDYAMMKAIFNYVYFWHLKMSDTPFHARLLLTQFLIIILKRGEFIATRINCKPSPPIFTLFPLNSLTSNWQNIQSNWTSYYSFPLHV